MAQPSFRGDHQVEIRRRRGCWSTTVDRTAARRHVFNGSVWRPTLREQTSRQVSRVGDFHALRHSYALAIWPSFRPPHLHPLMSSSQECTRRAVDGVYGKVVTFSDGMETA